MIKFQSFLSSSSGNCTFVTDDHTHLLVDCGAGGKYITECMRRIGVDPHELSGILITHEHRDHIAGVGILSRKYDIPVYATEKTWDAIGESLGRFNEQNKRLAEQSMEFGKMTVSSFPIPHDAAEPVGYSFETSDDKFTIATDLGMITDSLFEALKGSKSIIIEANHDTDMLKNGPYPFYLKRRIAGEQGHLSNELCGRLCADLAKTGTETIWLGHLSSENNRPELAYQTVSAILHELNEKNVILNVLPKYWIA
ncbi:MAG: MBL fold metallo-hydrolase [Clostridia bacterium]|nr:MBL fold metallo-hydrolase [Clostridia bacterium]